MGAQRNPRMVVKAAQLFGIAGAGFQIAEDLGGEPGPVETQPFDRTLSPEGHRQPGVVRIGQQRADGRERGGFVE
ncbi:hypothetical protein SSCI18S_02980 [Sphingobium scionense]